MMKIGEARSQDDGTGAMTTEIMDRSIARQRIPAGIWVLGFVSMLMDISSEMIHALLRRREWPTRLKVECWRTRDMLQYPCGCSDTVHS